MISVLIKKWNCQKLEGLEVILFNKNYIVFTWRELNDDKTLNEINEIKIETNSKYFLNFVKKKKLFECIMAKLVFIELLKQYTRIYF